MNALIALILSNLPTIMEAGKAGYDFILAIRSTAKQSGEWTDADEADFQAKIAGEAIDPAWQPD